MPNGKVDRRALPDPPRSRADLPTAFVAPHNSTQAKLEKIWAEVLFLDRVGIHDNFFDLGGHSLTASSVISRVIKSFQLELPVKALFDAPTIADLAKVILEKEAKKASEEDLKRRLPEGWSRDIWPGWLSRQSHPRILRGLRRNRTGESRL